MRVCACDAHLTLLPAVRMLPALPLPLLSAAGLHASSPVLPPDSCASSAPLTFARVFSLRTQNFKAKHVQAWFKLRVVSTMLRFLPDSFIQAVVGPTVCVAILF